MPTGQALALARERELDLVEVAPTSDPPVCRILDYGRLRYLYAKKERESKKSQKSTSLREVRFRPNISPNDLTSKMRKAKELLEKGSKVKMSVFFRGREMTHQQIGMSLLKQVVDLMVEEAKLEQAPSLEGRALSIVLAPLPKRGEKKSEEGQQVNDAKAEDTQGGEGEVPRDGLGPDHAEKADEQSQPPKKAQKSSTAVRRKKVPA